MVPCARQDAGAWPDEDHFAGKTRDSAFVSEFRILQPKTEGRHKAGPYMGLHNRDVSG